MSCSYLLCDNIREDDRSPQFYFMDDHGFSRNLRKPEEGGNKNMRGAEKN